jgi:hypothetical protein
LSKQVSGQLQLSLNREKQHDRNFHIGGRSFYFFDFDENIAFLATPSFLFHRETRQEVQLSSREFLAHVNQLGKTGPYKDYEIDLDAEAGTFRCFRDRDIGWLEKIFGCKQKFLHDVAAALGQPEVHWKGPSWDYFYHAVFNSRPISLITARGHHPETIKAGIRIMVKEKHLPNEPNYLGVYPVSHPEVLTQLGGVEGEIPMLKRKALRRSVEDAMKIYGNNPHHRFGMSDDDPKNLKWIMDEMKELKKQYPSNSFFVIETTHGRCVKHEILEGRVREQVCIPDVSQEARQLALFEENSD